MMLKLKDYRLLFGMMISVSVLIFNCGGGESQSNQETDTIKTEQKTEKDQLKGFEKGDPEQGQTFYVQFCSACHGQDALGLKGLGKDLVHSEFMAEMSDEEMLKYVNEGRTVDDPRNTTGIPMPPKGGN
ncbi:MAG: hypothetical protein GWN62_32795, partial [Aliifodinibius sp.]|nr:hypothetical protein [Fodinibius sp.]